MLHRKMLRDLWLHKIAFIAIFLMTFLGMFIYSGFNSEWNGMKESANAYYEETNMADAWMMTNSIRDTDLKDFQTTFPQSEGRLYIPVSDEHNTNSNIDLYAIDTNDISSFHLVDGIAFDNQSNGIWLDAAYAQKNSLKLGDTFSIVVQKESIALEIVGLIYSPEYVYSAIDGEMMPDHNKNGFAYVSKQQSIIKEVPYNQILIKSDQSKETLQNDMEKRSYLKGSTLIMKSDHTSVAMLQNEVIQHKAMSAIFPIAFLLIGFLTTITTMSKLTLDQRTQIGILQALGFPYRKIQIHYISHGFLVCSIGCLLGYLLGPILFPPLVYPFLESMYILPNLHGVPISYGNYILILCILLAFFVSYTTCHKQLKDVPAKTLRPLEPSIKKHKAKEHTNRFSFTTNWNARDIYRNKIRSFMTLFGVLGCSALIYCSSGLYDTMMHINSRMYQDITVYETQIQFQNETSWEEKERIKETYNGEYSYVNTIEIEANDIRKTGILNVQESTHLMRMQDTKQNYLDLPSDGIALSKKIADTLDLREGDTLSWRLYGEETWQTSSIAKIIRTPISQGMTMSKNYFEKTHVFNPQCVITKNTDVTMENTMQSIIHKADSVNNLDTLMEAMNTIILIMIFAAFILGGVVLYNLGTLSFLERQRELATLKVLGFSSKKLRKLLSQQNIWLTSIGICLGIPCGYALIYLITSTIGDSMDIMIYVEMKTYVFTILGTLFLSILINRFLFRKLRKIDMVSALKAIE